MPNTSTNDNRFKALGNQFVKILAILLTLLLVVKLVFGIAYKIHYACCKKRKITREKKFLATQRRRDVRRMESIMN